MSSIKSSISLLSSSNLFVSLFVVILSYAICNSSFPSKVNKFIVNYWLFHKFLFECNKDKDDKDTRKLNELFEKLLTKVQELLEKKHGKQIMDAGWCDLDETNIMTSRRSRTELNYFEEEELEEELEEEEEEEEVELEYEELEEDDSEEELEEDESEEELEEDDSEEELEEQHIMEELEEEHIIKELEEENIIEELEEENIIEELEEENELDKSYINQNSLS